MPYAVEQAMSQRDSSSEYAIINADDHQGGEKWGTSNQKKSGQFKNCARSEIESAGEKEREKSTGLVVVQEGSINGLCGDGSQPLAGEVGGEMGECLSIGGSEPGERVAKQGEKAGQRRRSDQILSAQRAAKARRRSC